MGLQIRDDRHMQALTGLSQEPLHPVLAVCSVLYETTQQHTSEAGVNAGTRRRKPGGGSKGTLPTRAEKSEFLLYYSKTYQICDVLGTPCAMARSKAHENLHKLSPMLYTTLVHLDLMPHRELTTPDELQAALHGMDQLIIDTTERAYRRSQDDDKQREHYRGKKNSIR